MALDHAAGSEELLTLADVRAAAERIGASVVHTPTLYSKTLSGITGANIWLKFENQQFTAAYKERGALNKLLLLTEEQRARGVIAASAGNHSQGLSYHGTRLGVPVTIVMPRTTPVVKVIQTQQVGGNVVLEGESFDEAYEHARTLEKQLGLTFVHPFDDPDVAAGQGTVALEMLADAPEIDTLAIPIGGGGLLSGMGVAARALKPDIRLIGVQPTLYPSMYGKLRGEELPAGGDTLGPPETLSAHPARTRAMSRRAMKGRACPRRVPSWRGRVPGAAGRARPAISGWPGWRLPCRAGSRSCPAAGAWPPARCPRA